MLCSKTFNSLSQRLAHLGSKQHSLAVENEKDVNRARDGKISGKSSVLQSSESQRKRSRVSQKTPSLPKENSENVKLSTASGSRRFGVKPLQPLQPTSAASSRLTGKASSEMNRLHRAASFGKKEAIAAVYSAIEVATTRSGRSTVPLFDLESQLDMRIYGVTDAGSHLLEHFMGLKKFLLGQEHHFKVSSSSFRQPNPEISIRTRVRGRSEPGKCGVRSNPSVSSSSGSASTEGAPETYEFPTLEESALAGLVGGIDVLHQMQSRPALDSVDGPIPFSFNRQARSFENPEAYVEVDRVALKKGEFECGICLRAKATHGTDPCACQHGFCETCLLEWLAKRKSGDFRCIACGSIDQFTGMKRLQN